MIPTIDLASYCKKGQQEINSFSPRREEVAKQWDEALKKAGLCFIINHGIAPGLISELRSTSAAFFALSEAEKLLFQTSNQYGAASGGYTPTGVESVALSLSGDAVSSASSSSDGVESFAFARHPRLFRAPPPPSSSSSSSGPPPAPLLPSFFPLAEQYFDSMTDLLNTLHNISCDALALPPDYFVPFYEVGEGGGGEDEEDSNGLALKLSNYPNSSCGSDAHRRRSQGLGSKSGPPTLRYGAHTDYQGFTILCPDPFDWQPLPPLTLTLAQTWSADMPSGGVRHDSDCSASAYVATRGGLEAFHKEANRWIPVILPRSDALVIS